MKTWYVSSGDMSEEVNCDSGRDAIVTALSRRRWTYLGLIAIARTSPGSKMSGDDLLWLSTYALSAAGFECEETSK